MVFLLTIAGDCSCESATNFLYSVAYPAGARRWIGNESTLFQHRNVESTLQYFIHSASCASCIVCKVACCFFLPINFWSLLVYRFYFFLFFFSWYFFILLLHGPPMLVDKTNFDLVLYNHTNLYRFDETSNYWLVK